MLTYSLSIITFRSHFIIISTFICCNNQPLVAASSDASAAPLIRRGSYTIQSDDQANAAANNTIQQQLPVVASVAQTAPVTRMASIVSDSSMDSVVTFTAYMYTKPIC